MSRFPGETRADSISDQTVISTGADFFRIVLYKEDFFLTEK